MPSPTPQHRPESDTEARARHLQMLREMAELGMRAARVATDRIEANAAKRDDAPEPSLILARGTHATRQAIALEQRVRAGIAAAPSRAPVSAARPCAPGPRDPRRPLLRDALRNAAKSEPDRAVRAQTCRFIDERLDVELLGDPDGDIPIGEILLSIADEFGLVIDVAKLPDELLGPPRPHWPPSKPDFTLYSPRPP